LVPGDFNSDARITDADIDQMTAAVIPGPDASDTYDFTGDLQGTSADRDYFVQVVLDTNYGDLDLDCDVDTLDVNTQLVNWTGATGPGSGKLWATGDIDGDTDVDTFDTNTALTNWTGALAGGDNIPDLYYNPANGNITIDGDGADMGGFTLLSAGSNFTGDPADFSDLPAGVTDDIDNQVGWSNAFSGHTGTADLGNIMVAGLTPAQLLADLAGSIYAISIPGGGGGGAIQINYIPEPSSAVLLILGGMAGLFLFRRKR
jgi:hypothetical protein